MHRSSLKIFFVLLLIIDLGFSFIQHYHKSLDGDVSSIVLGYPEVMHDPFGLRAAINHEYYGGSNRFFAHWTMSEYMRHMPIVLQSFSSPVESVYLSCALIKTLIQFIIIFGLSFIISDARKVSDTNVLLTAVLITPLFQTNGYNGYMGIISSSITYTFFYALPVSLIILAYLFLFNSNIRINTARCIAGMLALIILVFNGPLNPAVIFLGVIVVALRYISGNKILADSSDAPRLSMQSMMLFIWAAIISAYSLYVGHYNAENNFHDLSIVDRYAHLPLGIYYSLTQKLGLPLLLLIVLLNSILIKKFSPPEKNKFLTQCKWIGAYCALYLIILPLGGYREYRPNIIRSDTLLPVLILVIYLYGYSTLILLRDRAFLQRRIYITGIIIFLAIFSIADSKIICENDCEKDALLQIANSSQPIVRLENNCNVMSWNKTTDYNNSKLNCELLEKWNIVRGRKMYFQN